MVVSTDEDLNANSLYLYSQCSFRTEDYTACVKALTILAKRWPNTPLIKTGYVTRFCYYLINEVANLQTNWDYYRFKERTADDGSPLWKRKYSSGLQNQTDQYQVGIRALPSSKDHPPHRARNGGLQKEVGLHVERPHHHGMGGRKRAA